MSEKRLLLIVNPYSGKAKMTSNLMAVTRILSDRGFEVTVYPTKNPGDATLRAAKVRQDEFERIVVCGGDGTLNEVLTGLMQASVSVKIGYVPAGTLNEWSASLKIPRSIPKAAKAATEESELCLDIGRFDNRYFSYTASFGAFTEASYSTPQGIKNFLGQTAYLLEGIKQIGHIHATHLKIESEEMTVEDDFIFGAVSNSMSVGGIVKFKDTLVKLNDGLFEVLLVRKPKNVFDLQKTVDGILKGDFAREGLVFFHTKRVKVTGGEGLAWTLDGEYAKGTDKLIIENVPGALRLVTPENSKESE